MKRRYKLATLLLALTNVMLLEGQGCSKMEFSADNKAILQNSPNISVSVKILSAPKALDNQTEAVFDFIGEVSDGSAVSKYICIFDGKSNDDCKPGEVYKSLAQGDHHFEVVAESVVAKSDSARYDWKVDSIAPKVTILTSPKSVTNLTSGSFTFAANDANGSGVDVILCKLESQPFLPCSDLKRDFTGIADGKKAFMIQATDKAGNKADVNYEWLVDTVAPTVAISEMPSNPSNAKDVKLVFSGKDDSSGVAKYLCKFDAATSFSDCSTPQMYNSVSQSQHDFEVKAVDFAGNSSAPAKANWMSDLTVPTVKITKAPSSYDKSPSGAFEFVATDNESGVLKIQCSLNTPNNYKDCSSPYTFANLSDGPHSFYVKAIDKAGNESSPAIHQWTIDTISPVVAFVSTPKNPTTEKSASFTYTIDETGSGLDKFSCKLDSADFDCLVQGSVLILNLSLGDHILTVSASDKAGNIGSASYSWKVEDPAPKCYQDIYNQPDFEITKKIDILFVTDTSSSLDEEKTAIAAGIDSFVAQLPVDVDFQIAVTLAHGSKSAHTGKLYKSTKGDGFVLGNKTLSLATIRQQLSYKLSGQPGDDTDGGEMGMYSLSQLLKDSNYSLAQSQGFFRPDAATAIVFIADENDICAIYPVGVTPVVDTNNSEPVVKARDCPGLSHGTVYTQLKNRRANLPVLVSGIVYTNPATVPRSGENEVGYGYIDLIKLSGDSAVDLASSDYAKGLSTIGGLVNKKLNLLTSFKLKYDNIDPASIVVKVDGKVVKHTYVMLTNEVQIGSNDAGTAKSVVVLDYCQKAPIMVSSAN
ncbi:MAG: hypothetical protein A4S09_08740 [Proteobacteria bacterium SG_bin7]|nr:MAG: hypothetical protein A4S09_08740 [Proteobacteria bacterium SG_bin7]